MTEIHPGRSSLNVVCIAVPDCGAPLQEIDKCAQLAARALEIQSGPVNARALDGGSHLWAWVLGTAGPGGMARPWVPACEISSIQDSSTWKLGASWGIRCLQDKGAVPQHA